MTQFRLATFNAENLLSRFDYGGWHNDLQKDRALALFDIRDEASFKQLEAARMVSTVDDVRQQTALAIAAADADILCLQEVDDAQALNAFEFGYLFKMMGDGYRGKHVSRGNDGRGIDVGAMFRPEADSGQPISLIKAESHAALTYKDLGLFNADLASREMNPDDRIFKRDCLALTFDIGGKPFTQFVVHFKSMGADTFGGEASAREADFAICGDFNDYQRRIDISGKPGAYRFQPVVAADRSSLDVLLGDRFAVNVVETLPRLEQWTLYHTRGPQERHLCQLDYILLSPALAAKNRVAKPEIIRQGQPFRVIAPDGQIRDRFPRIGWDRPKASDHCPVAITLQL
jgi:endonuclease/exonuclease/phosphatase family metal-dependent hydrolase